MPPVPVASALVSSVSEEEHLTAAAVRLEDPLDSTGQPDCAVKQTTPSGETGPSCFASVLSRTSCKPLPCDVVHRRLAHLSASRMKSLVSNGLCVEGELGDKSFEHCTVCMEGKMTRRPFLSRPLTQRATKPMERLHLDLIGPFPCKSTYGAAAYVLTVTDERSGRKFVFLLHHKSQAFEVFSAWHR